MQSDELYITIMLSLNYGDVIFVVILLKMKKPRYDKAFN